MASRVTIQDIADELGVSRNTVSKAINNTGILAEATKERVIQKAIEMGYKQFSYMKLSDTPAASGRQDPLTMESAAASPTPAPAGEKREIALISSSFINNSHFGSLMLDRFQREISQYGYVLTFHRCIIEENAVPELPITFSAERTAGIICLEVFDYPYAKMLCDLNIPILFVDGPVDALFHPLNADFLNMNNKMHMYTVVNEMLQRGVKNIGFVGEIHHCQAFFERYIGLRDAMLLAGHDVKAEQCLTGNKQGVKNPTYDDYREYLYTSFRDMSELPELIVCANDFVAFDVMNTLDRLKIQVPDDVMVCGFDDSSESKLVNPPLSTIHIHTQIMGIEAARLLLSRIQDPDMNYRTMYTETTLMLRRSTGD